MAHVADTVLAVDDGSVCGSDVAKPRGKTDRRIVSLVVDHVCKLSCLESLETSVDLHLDGGSGHDPLLICFVS